MKNCPRCKRRTMLDAQSMNCLSRRDGKTYICKSCGNEEAAIDLGCPITERERNFTKTHKRKR